MTEPVRPDAATVPHPSRFDPDQPGFAAAMAAHRTAQDRAEAGYLDPGSGLFVLTAAYLLARGTCCDSGCRHCPYLGATSGERSPRH